MGRIFEDFEIYVCTDYDYILEKEGYYSREDII